MEWKSVPALGLAVSTFCTLAYGQALKQHHKAQSPNGCPVESSARGPSIAGIRLGETAEAAMRNAQCFNALYRQKFTQYSQDRILKSPNGVYRDALEAVIENPSNGYKFDYVKAELLGPPGAEHVVTVNRFVNYLPGTEPTVSIVLKQFSETFGMVPVRESGSECANNGWRNGDGSLSGFAYTPPNGGPTTHCVIPIQCNPQDNRGKIIDFSCGTSIIVDVTPSPRNSGLVSAMTLSMGSGQVASRQARLLKQVADAVNGRQRENELNDAKKRGGVKF